MVGHTDARGSAGYNKRLSQNRAEAVKRYLIEAGVAAQRLVSEGQGESMLLYPHLPNDARNRRVQLINLGSTTTEDSAKEEME